MNYKISVPQMHCTGCDALMKLTLEDDFQNIKPDHKNHIVEFESDKNIDEIKQILNKIFDEFREEKLVYTFDLLTKNPKLST